MNKYITIIEVGNGEDSNVGTITTLVGDINKKFTKAVESHFDAAIVKFSFIHPEVDKIVDCIDAMPIDILVTLDVDGFEQESKVELSQTWLYE